VSDQVRAARSCADTVEDVMSRKQTRLLTITTPHPRATVHDLAHPTAAAAAPAPGAVDEDLLCGGCGAVVLPGWSVAETSTTLVVEAHLLLRCARCRAYSVVPTRRVDAPGDTWLRRGRLRLFRPSAAAPPGPPLPISSRPNTAPAPFRSYMSRVRGSFRS
jgi:hypothetical protein